MTDEGAAIAELVTLEMVASRTFDGRLQLREYVPTVITGPPGSHPAS